MTMNYGDVFGKIGSVYNVPKWSMCPAFKSASLNPFMNYGGVKFKILVVDKLRWAQNAELINIFKFIN